jgi:hypothetical protein
MTPRALGPASDGYDPAQRAAAASLQRGHPGWVILYGPWTRRFWAFGCFPSPEPILLSAAGPTDLRSQMRAAEAAIGPPPAPAPLGIGARSRRYPPAGG